MASKLKNEILRLRNSGKSYREISNTLGCSRSNISYHCSNNNLNDIGLKPKKLSKNDILEMNEFYKNNTIKETSLKFNVSISTVKKYVSNKRLVINEEEKKSKKYNRLKSYRQKTKLNAINYKGNKCEKCGYSKCIWALEFHHKNKLEKDFQFSKYSNHSWSKIKNELDKCILLCSNCHREIHYNDFLSNNN